MKRIESMKRRAAQKRPYSEKHVERLLNKIEVYKTQRDGYRQGYEAYKARCFRLESELSIVRVKNKKE